jgi:hypothetical protein
MGQSEMFKIQLEKVLGINLEKYRDTYNISFYFTLINKTLFPFFYIFFEKHDF